MNKFQVYQKVVVKANVPYKVIYSKQMLLHELAVKF